MEDSSPYFSSAKNRMCLVLLHYSHDLCFSHPQMSMKALQWRQILLFYMECKILFRFSFHYNINFVFFLLEGDNELFEYKKKKGWHTKRNGRASLPTIFEHRRSQFHGIYKHGLGWQCKQKNNQFKYKCIEAIHFKGKVFHSLEHTPWVSFKICKTPELECLRMESNRTWRKQNLGEEEVVVKHLDWLLNDYLFLWRQRISSFSAPKMRKTDSSETSFLFFLFVWRLTLFWNFLFF